MDDSYTVYALATVWADVSIMEINNMLVTTFAAWGRSIGYLACRALFARCNGFCSSIWRRQGPDGPWWRTFRRESLLTGPINLGMIWRMKSELMTIRMLEYLVDGLNRFLGFVSLVPYWSFPVLASMTSPGRTACYRSAVSWKSTKGINWQNEKEEASPSSQSLQWTLTISCWRWSRVSCRHTWEPELVSSFHHDRSWTNFVFLYLFVGGGSLFCRLFVVLLSITFP